MAHVSELLETAATLFAVTPNELRRPSQAQRIAHARFAVAWALRKHDPRRSFAAIGEMLGGRNHATFLYAIERAEALACLDADYALRLAELWPDGEQARRLSSNDNRSYLHD